MDAAHQHARPRGRPDADHGRQRGSRDTGCPRARLPPDVAYQIVHDELMLDGNARLNLATFVTTWMEPQAGQLMAECLDKNMIDKDEYPQTAELEARCVEMLADLWHAPDAARRPAAPRPGRARLHARRARAQAPLAAAPRRPGQARRRPNIVMGVNVQVCWEKFANYWEVEPRLVPMEGDRFHLSADEAVALCDENTIGVVAILGSTFDGTYEPVAEICAALDDLQERTGLDIPVHVDGASGGVRRAVHRPRSGLGLPAAAGRVDQHLGPQVRARLPRRRLGRVARRRRAARRPGLPGQLPRRQHADLRARTSPAPARRSSRSTTSSCASASRATPVQGYSREVATRPRRADRRARPVPAAHPRRRAAGVRLHAQRRRQRYTVFDVSAALRERGWQVPAYTFPENREDLAALRVVVRSGFTHDLADLLLDDLRRVLPRLESGSAHGRRGRLRMAFHH